MGNYVATPSGAAITEPPDEGLPVGLEDGIYPKKSQ